MNEKNFNDLSRIERERFLRAKGIYLAAREIIGYRAYLYYLGSFYVELYIHSMTNQILWIEIQRNKQILDEYLDQISIDELF